MKDMVLEQRLRHCQQLMEAWQRFHQYLMACIKGQEFNAQAENDFLKVKSQIAILHDSFLASVPKGSRETAATSQSVISLVEKCILLRQVKRLNVAELKRMEMEWHEAYLLINDTIGILQEEVAKLAGESEFHHKMAAFNKKLKAYVGGATHNKGLQAGVGVVAVLVVAIVLPMMGVFSYDALDKGAAQKPYRAVRKVVRKTVAKELKFLDLGEYNDSGFNLLADFSFKDDDNLKRLFEGLFGQVVKAAGNPLEGTETAIQCYETLNDQVPLIGRPTPTGKAPVLVFRAKMKGTNEAKEAQGKLDAELAKIPANSPAKRIKTECHINVLCVGFSPYSDEAIKTLGENLAKVGK